MPAASTAPRDSPAWISGADQRVCAWLWCLQACVCQAPLLAHYCSDALTPDLCLQDLALLQGELAKRQHLEAALPPGQPLPLHQLAAALVVRDPGTGQPRPGPHVLMKPQPPLHPVPGTGLTVAAWEHAEYCRREVGLRLCPARLSQPSLPCGEESTANPGHAYWAGLSSMPGVVLVLLSPRRGEVLWSAQGQLRAWAGCA